MSANDNNNYTTLFIVGALILAGLYYFLKFLGVYVSYLIILSGVIYFIYNSSKKKNVVSWWDPKEKSKFKSNLVNSSIVIGFGLLVFGTTKLFFPFTACECAKLIAKNGIITYGDLKSYEQIGGSVYKEFKKTYDCSESYDYDDLADCDISDAYY